MKTEEINKTINKFFKKKYPKGFELVDNASKYSYNRSNKAFTADNEIINSDGVDLVCVEKKFTKKDLQENIQKWILLSIKAKRQNGELYVFTKDDQKANFQSVVDKMQIKLELQSL